MQPTWNGHTSVAKQRMVDTKFWDDSYIVGLKPMEKLVFLYLLTTPLTNISGVYELPLRRVAFDTGIPADRVEATFQKFESDGKVIFSEGWVTIVNFIKHQKLNPKNKIGVISALNKAPKHITDRLSIDYQTPSIGLQSLSHLKSNSLRENNLKPFKTDVLSTGFPQDIKDGRGELLKIFSVRMQQ